MHPAPMLEKPGDAPNQSHVWPPWALAAALTVFTIYANHFHNSFHFDDFHTITQNPAIRSLHQVPHFFADPKIFSVLPTHQSYHPLVTASLAVDYWLGGGLNPL